MEMLTFSISYLNKTFSISLIGNPTIIIIIADLIAPDQTTVQDCVKTIRSMSQTSEIINLNLTK